MLFLLKVGAEYSRGAMIVFTAFAVGLALLGRLVVGGASRYGVRRGVFTGRRVVALGDPAELARLGEPDFQRFGIEDIARIAIGGGSIGGRSERKRPPADRRGHRHLPAASRCGIRVVHSMEPRSRAFRGLRPVAQFAAAGSLVPRSEDPRRFSPAGGASLRPALLGHGSARAHERERTRPQARCGSGYCDDGAGRFGAASAGGLARHRARQSGAGRFSDSGVAGSTIANSSFSSSGR